MIITTITMRGKMYEITEKTTFMWDGACMQMFPDGWVYGPYGPRSIVLTKKATEEIRAYTWNTKAYRNKDVTMFTLGVKA